MNAKKELEGVFQSIVKDMQLPSADWIRKYDTKKYWEVLAQAIIDAGYIKNET